MSRSPFPLQWPDGWPRTPPSRRAPWRGGEHGLAWARDGLVDELRLLGAARVVITSDLPVRGDGLPYANGRAEDPGIAVWWSRRAGDRWSEEMMACDRWMTHAANLRAIAKTVEALRGIERWGSTSIVARAFAGFAALPPGDAAAPACRPWREVLGMDRPHLNGVDPQHLLDIAKACHRRLIVDAHPDAGGSHDRAAELNAALADAERELRGER